TTGACERAAGEPAPASRPATHPAAAAAAAAAPAGTLYSYDLRSLCNANADYTLTDAVGHTYYAQICGTAAKSCLPETWENEYEY
ncbi:hypothetical protein OFN63_36615, partial [Escherichia coli]|nr:hypothetical protein [Escherichia coli]